MVKKLIKHEFVYYFRTFSIFIPIMLAIAVMTKIISFLDIDNSIGRLAVLSSNSMLFMAAAALFIMSIVVGIVRFYQNMYSSEGYLTFTLPQSSSQHILAKLSVACVLRIVCLLTIAAAFAIVWIGTPEFNTVIAEIWEELQEYPFNMGNFIDKPYRIFVNILWIIVPLLMVVADLVTSQLLFYCCITIGQLAKRNRIMLAIGAYFAWYMIAQTAATVWLTLEMFFVPGLAIFINRLFNKISLDALLVIFGIMILLYIAFAALFWFVTRRIMDRKLNLE